jgi:hypothetical protein
VPAEAYDVLRVPGYRTLATSAFDSYGAQTYVSASSLCSGCGYFWYSDHRNDVGRYVKNTNIEMAVAALAIDRYIGDVVTRRIGMAAAKAHFFEIAERGNYNYLGVADARYDVRVSKWDAHNPFEAYLLLRAGEMLGNEDYVAVAKAHYEAYAPHGSGSTLAYGACHFARYSADAKITCEAWVESMTAGGAAGVGLVMDYR